MKLFADVKGYATVANAEKAAAKKNIDLSQYHYSVVVTDAGRFTLCFPMGLNNDPRKRYSGVDFAHLGFCVTN